LSSLPETENSVVLRTDFTDDGAWDAVCAAIRQPYQGFRAHVELLTDPQYEGLTVAQILSLIPRGSKHTFAFVVDRATLSSAEHPVLVVDLYDEPGRTFRVVPSELWGVENNLSIANMDFREFADAVDRDGVFRGFPEG